MKELNFKNYPPRVLIGLVLLFAAITIFIKQLIIDHTLNFNIFATLLVTVGIIGFGFFIINKFLMWKLFLRLLGIADIRGNYSGELISSFHKNDNPVRPNIKMKIDIQIVQNINGIKIFGQVAPLKEKKNKVTDFVSEWVRLQALENGKYLLEYRYIVTNSNILGFANLTYCPNDKTLKGFYFTYNQSKGSLFLNLKK